MLILAGGNDPRCPKSESQQVLDAVKKRGGTAELKIYEDEGHGFARVENQIDSWNRIAEFVKAHVPPADCGCSLNGLVLFFVSSCFFEPFANGFISPAMVNFLASMSTGKPSSRSVAEVTGPMEAKRTPSSNLLRAIVGSALPRNSRPWKNW